MEKDWGEREKFYLYKDIIWSLKVNNKLDESVHRPFKIAGFVILIRWLTFFSNVVSIMIKQYIDSIKKQKDGVFWTSLHCLQKNLFRLLICFILLASAFKSHSLSGVYDHSIYKQVRLTCLEHVICHLVVNHCMNDILSVLAPQWRHCTTL